MTLKGYENQIVYIPATPPRRDLTITNKDLQIRILEEQANWYNPVLDQG